MVRIKEISKKEINEKWAEFKVGSKPDRATMFAVMSGTYNLAATKNIFNWEKYVEDCLSNCWDKTLAAMIFNVQVSKEARISKENILGFEKPTNLHRPGFEPGTFRSSDGRSPN